ncbi:hypothetical protein [Anatilimnocola floriformis]|uniref:hypothetical protein n=1 Tax=Anatilimnocola floriformis TaxID=2948575 RepID=UPI0020C2F591|nr:hypothetical protein [Anatilimnocola floriformis]
MSGVVTLEAAAWEHIVTATVWHLLHSVELSDLVGSRIYPSYAVQQGHFKAKSPLILYEMTDYQHEHDLDGAAGVALATIQFDVMSNSHSEAIAVANALKAELQGYSDMLHSRDAFNVWLENQSEASEQPDPGSDVTIYVQTLIFNVLHRETSPMLLLPYDLGSKQVEKGIVTYLLSQPSLSAIDNRLFPLRRPQRSELPAIVYRRKSTTEDLDLEGGIDIVQPVFEFEIISDNHAEVYLLSEHLRNVLDGLTGAIGETNTLTVTMLGESEACELQGAGKQTAYYRLTQEYEFMHRN